MLNTKVNKKGISNIIATVMIVLLSLAAVVIVWQFASGNIRQNITQANLQTECLNFLNSVKIISCSDKENNQNFNVVSVTARLNNGNPSNGRISFLFANANGNKYLQDKKEPLGQLYETKKYSNVINEELLSRKLGSVLNIKVAPVITAVDNQGRERKCGEPRAIEYVMCDISPGAGGSQNDSEGYG